jgi:hypothetical protein
MMMEFTKNEENVLRVVVQNETIETKINEISNGISNNQVGLLQLNEEVKFLRSDIDDQNETIKLKTNLMNSENEQRIKQLGWNEVQMINTNVNDKAREQQNFIRLELEMMEEKRKNNQTGHRTNHQGQSNNRKENIKTRKE